MLLVASVHLIEKARESTCVLYMEVSVTYV